MKKRTFVFVSAIIITLMALTACSSSPERPTVEVTYEEFQEVQDTISRVVSKEIEVEAGSSFIVTLWSNQTTGFSWSEFTLHGEENIVELVSHEYTTPSENNNESQMVGADGNEVWILKALKSGTIDISMKYSQPWEGGKKGAFSFFLSVVVK
jgi:predicted secreted protein